MSSRISTFDGVDFLQHWPHRACGPAAAKRIYLIGQLVRIRLLFLAKARAVRTRSRAREPKISQEKTLCRLIFDSAIWAIYLTAWAKRKAHSSRQSRRSRCPDLLIARKSRKPSIMLTAAPIAPGTEILSKTTGHTF